MDNIVITGLDSTYISQLKHALSSEFHISDLGKLSYFLGIKILNVLEGIFVSQTKYLPDLLNISRMSVAK